MDANPHFFFVVSVPPWPVIFSHKPVLEVGAETDGKSCLMLLGKCTVTASAC